MPEGYRPYRAFQPVYTVLYSPLFASTYFLSFRCLTGASVNGHRDEVSPDDCLMDVDPVPLEQTESSSDVCPRDDAPRDGDFVDRVRGSC